MKHILVSAITVVVVASLYLVRADTQQTLIASQAANTESGIAAIHAALGDKDKAFAELEKAFGEHDWFLPRLKVDPFMDQLRDDPRFKEMLKRLNLPE
jgi:hypothetical protein